MKHDCSCQLLGHQAEHHLLLGLQRVGQLAPKLLAKFRRERIPDPLEELEVERLKDDLSQIHRVARMYQPYAQAAPTATAQRLKIRRLSYGQPTTPAEPTTIDVEPTERLSIPHAAADLPASDEAPA